MIDAERCRAYGSPRKPGAMKRLQGVGNTNVRNKAKGAAMRDIFVGVQYSAGIKRPVFDSSQFKDLDLDCRHGQTGEGNQGSSSAFITSSIGIRYPMILKGPMGPFKKPR